MDAAVGEAIDHGRRSLIVATVAASGGLALGLRPFAMAAGSSPDPEIAPHEVEMSPWLVITPDGTITVRVTTPECGNGAMTQMAMTVSEELACDWNWGGYGKPRVGTTICAIATVGVAHAGELQVHAIDVAFDCGRILNRDAVLTEIQGGVVFGLNMALNETLTIDHGRIVEGNFNTYPMIRMADTPTINVHFGALSGHERFSEIGEAAVGVIGPTIGNAIFRITGKRIRSTPFRLHDLRWS